MNQGIIEITRPLYQDHQFMEVFRQYFDIMGQKPKRGSILLYVRSGWIPKTLDGEKLDPLFRHLNGKYWLAAVRKAGHGPGGQKMDFPN